ncbi:hypothetical protein PROFUN_12378 [Planoprotostelium fungivorum]|uniref:TRAF-type domain-containing protein n=1 Tax=Planoprotostelium fungivorum TaxID=1890364 RepID=A0A2P6N7G8_9EUKA|nr:hypothetical protein PROFUN_12378 [Planoprotostelium fungivorum]
MWKRPVGRADKDPPVLATREVTISLGLPGLTFLHRDCYLFVQQCIGALFTSCFIEQDMSQCHLGFLIQSLISADGSSLTVLNWVAQDQPNRSSLARSYHSKTSTRTSSTMILKTTTTHTPLILEKKFHYPPDAIISEDLICIGGHPLEDPIVLQCCNMGCEATTDRILVRTLKLLDSLIVVCNMCYETMERQKLNDHPDCRTVAPNAVADHVRECLGEEVKCSGEKFLCPWKGRRGQMKEHQNVCKHLETSSPIEQLLDLERNHQQELEKERTLHKLWEEQTSALEHEIKQQKAVTLGIETSLSQINTICHLRAHSVTLQPSEKWSRPA